MELIKNTVRKKLMNPEREINKVTMEKFSKYNVIKHKIGSSYILTISKNENQNIAKHILFFHGGAYVHPGSDFHKNTVKRFVKLGYKVSYFEYPLGPQNNIQDMVDFSLKGYSYLKEAYGKDDFVIFGDSAGGGLALLLQQELKKAGSIIQKAVLSSPWLDLSLSHEDIEIYEKKDRFLPLDTLQLIGKQITGKYDVKDERVSPIFSNLDDLGAILLFYTDSEILKPDCDDFIEKAKKAQNTTIESYVAHKLPHDYVVITHFPQSKKAIEKVDKFYHESN